MIESNYLPKSEEALLDWLKNFSNHLLTEGVELGITPAEISALNGLILSVKNDIRSGNGRMEEEKELKKEAMMKFIYSLVSKIKKHPSYIESDYGKKFGIA